MKTQIRKRNLRLNWRWNAGTTETLHSCFSIIFCKSILEIWCIFIVTLFNTNSSSNHNFPFEKHQSGNFQGYKNASFLLASTGKKLVEEVLQNSFILLDMAFLPFQSHSAQHFQLHISKGDSHYMMGDVHGRCLHSHTSLSRPPQGSPSRETRTLGHSQTCFKPLL